jgi:ABC-type Fe3+ transport system permease subunit
MGSLAVFFSVGGATDAINSGAIKACGTSCNTATTVGGIFTNIATTLTFVIGGISVIMIIIGGLRYVLSNGDSKAVGEAKNTILYAVIGVIVAIMAYAIIGFVTENIK